MSLQNLFICNLLCELCVSLYNSLTSCVLITEVLFLLYNMQIYIHMQIDHLEQVVMQRLGNRMNGFLCQFTRSILYINKC